MPSSSASVADAELPLPPLLAAEAGVVAERDRVQLSLKLQPARVPFA
jgi:hypothetical protein